MGTAADLFHQDIPLPGLQVRLRDLSAGRTRAGYRASPASPQDTAPTRHHAVQRGGGGRGQEVAYKGLLRTPYSLLPNPSRTASSGPPAPGGAARGARLPRPRFAARNPSTRHSPKISRVRRSAHTPRLSSLWPTRTLSCSGAASAKGQPRLGMAAGPERLGSAAAPGPPATSRPRANPREGRGRGSCTARRGIGRERGRGGARARRDAG